MSRTVPDDWEIAPLHTLAQARSSNVDKKCVDGEVPVKLCNYMDVYSNNVITNELPFMEATAKEREIEKFLVERGDVIITKDSETPDDIAVSAYVREELDGVICGYHLTLLKPKKNTSGEFLTHLFRLPSVQHHFYILANGITRFGLTIDAINDAPMPVPPLPEQQKIAAILTSVDNVIETTQAQIDKLKDLKTGMMQELLTKGIGHTEFKDSPVGRIPVEWEALTIRDLVNFKGGSQPPRDTFVFDERPGYIRLLQIRDYKSDRFATYIPESLARRWCEKDDIMIGRYGPPIFQILRGKSGSYNVALIKAEPLNGKLDKGYLYHFLCRKDLFQLIDSYSQRTSGQTGIDMNALNDFGFPLPSLKEQKSIAERLDHMDKTLDTKQSKLSALISLKKALMQDLLTGKVRVKVD